MLMTFSFVEKCVIRGKLEVFRWLPIEGVGSKIAINKGWGWHVFFVSYSHRQGDGYWQDIISVKIFYRIKARI